MGPLKQGQLAMSPMEAGPATAGINLNQVGLRILVPIVAVITLTGCSPEARRDYSAAGSSVATAAKDTGKAIGADAKAVGHSVANAANGTTDPNDDTTKRIKKAILDAPDIQTNDLVVEADDRKVTLRGTVQSEIQNQLAEHLARRLLGSAYEVDDQLQVSPGP